MPFACRRHTHCLCTKLLAHPNATHKHTNTTLKWRKMLNLIMLSPRRRPTRIHNISYTNALTMCAYWCECVAYREYHLLPGFSTKCCSEFIIMYIKLITGVYVLNIWCTVVSIWLFNVRTLCAFTTFMMFHYEYILYMLSFIHMSVHERNEWAIVCVYTISPGWLKCSQWFNCRQLTEHFLHSIHIYVP